MSLVNQTINWGCVLNCPCPKQVVIEFKESTFIEAANLAANGKFVKATLVDSQLAPCSSIQQLTLRYDNVVLADPDLGFTACDIATICCLTCFDRYLIEKEGYLIPVEPA
jgi:hypothetical protein